MSDPTIKDIAKILNISNSTVSRALRDSYEISSKTKMAVLAVAKELNYHPSPIAQSLKGNISHSIGIIVPEIDNPFFSQTIDGIESVASSFGYHVVIFQSQESFSKEVANIKHLISRKVDGVLISLTAQTEKVDHLLQAQKNGLPIVMFDRVSSEIKTHKIMADNFEGAFQATDYLAKSGRKRIAHIAASNFLSITKERIAGYHESLLRNGLAYDHDLVKFCGYNQEEMNAAIEELLKLKSPPDAILTVSDRLAVDCLNALKLKKIKIPEEIAFIAFTNLKVANMLLPSLSTVYQPAFEMGRMATELLIELIEKKSKKSPTVFKDVVLPMKLTFRDSSLQS